MTGPRLHVLVAVDGSELASDALDWAISIARRTDATLSICSVVDPMPTCVGAATGAPYDPGPMLASLEDDASRFCADGVARARAGRVAATSRVFDGVPSNCIADFATEGGSDVIVLGTHARHGLALGIMGSVTEAIVRSSDAAVVVIRAESTLSDRGPVVVAVDDSESSMTAAQFALRLASALDVPVHLVHVTDGSRIRPSSLARIATAAQLAGVSCSEDVRSGPVVGTLIACAVESGASLIATGTHGRGPVTRLLLGSVADGLIRRSSVPVLTHRAATR